MKMRDTTKHALLEKPVISEWRVLKIQPGTPYIYKAEIDFFNINKHHFN